MTVLFRLRLFAMLFCVVIIAIDQSTKIWALSALQPYYPVMLTSYLNLTLAFNTGAAFSILSGGTLWHTWFFLIFCSLMVGILGVWFYRVKAQERLLRIGLVCILAGAISNLWDRLTLGQVVDFIDLHYGIYHWPIFNVADCAICVGALLIMISWKQ